MRERPSCISLWYVLVVFANIQDKVLWHLAKDADSDRAHSIFTVDIGWDWCRINDLEIVPGLRELDFAGQLCLAQARGFVAKLIDYFSLFSTVLLDLFSRGDFQIDWVC